MKRSSVFMKIFLLLLAGAGILFWMGTRKDGFEWREHVSFNEQAHLVVVESRYPLGSWFSPDAIEFGFDRITYYENGFMGDHVIEIEYRNIDSIYLVEGLLWRQIDIQMPGKVSSKHYRIYFTKKETADEIKRPVKAHFFDGFKYEEKRSLLKNAWVF